MLFSLSQEASQGLPAEKARPTGTVLFVKFNMQGGLVKEIRLQAKTPFWKLKRAVCQMQDLRADDVCLFFGGKELLPDQRTSDAEMHNGAVVSVIERKLVYATLEPAGQSSRVPRMLQGADFTTTLDKVVRITGAASSQALIDAIEEPGWIKATPKLVQLAGEFYGDRELLPPAAPDESEDEVPLAMLKEVREGKRRRTNLQNGF